jgi:2-C-methyl-D-erythritol 4-phosphate cytidylyltransferase
MKNAAIIVAAGKGKRFGGPLPKQYVKVHGREILARAIDNFEGSSDIGAIVVVVAEGYKEFVEKNIISKYGYKKVIGVINGGVERYNSVYNALAALKGHKPLNVLIHDGARPMVEAGLITQVARALKKERAVIPVKKVTLTVKEVKDGYIKKTIDRDKLRTADTPQGFRFMDILKLYGSGRLEKHKPTDDASVFERAGIRVKAIEHEGFNIKVTTQHDIKILKSMLGNKL